MLAVYIFSLVFGLSIILIDLMGLLGPQDEGASSDGDGPDSSDTGDSTDLNADDQAVVLPDSNKGRWVYMALNTLRSTVYFCCGFGAVGVYGQVTSNPSLKTLIYSTATGIILMLIVKAISRLQSRVSDSQLTNGDLLFAEAEVLVSINPGKLGKVRVHTGGSYHDLFAKGEDKKKTYAKGSKVFVVDASSTEVVVHDSKTE